jgi:hypothetical protein
MNVDVELYIHGIVNFFKENQEDLLNLVPKEKEDIFYMELKSASYKNYENGVDVILTQDQIVEIVSKINNRLEFQYTKIGVICLN